MIFPYFLDNAFTLSYFQNIVFQHFVGGAGPTPKHPAPVPADGSKVHTARLDRGAKQQKTQHEVKRYDGYFLSIIVYHSG